MLAEDSEDIAAESDLGTDEGVPTDTVLYRSLSDARAAVTREAAMRNQAAFVAMVDATSTSPG